MTRSPKFLARYREARSLELATGGASWDAIAQELGYADRSGAWRAAQRALARRIDEAVDMYRHVSVAELDMTQEKVWPAAMAGNLRAADVVVRTIERKDRLLGLSLAAKREDEDFRRQSRLAAEAALLEIRRGDEDRLGPFRDLGC